MTIEEIFINTSLFFGLYFAIFLFVTFFENRKRVYVAPREFMFPGVTLIVPCLNEARFIAKTLNSIIGLDYPKDKLEVIVVDDGSTDNTFQIAKEFELKDNRIRVLKQSNGGKYSALNLGIKEAKYDFIGTVDSDSYFHKESVRKIMYYFSDPSLQVVVSTVVISNPKNILEGLQYIEYAIGNFMRKIFSFLDSISVVPGPLSIFKKEVFEKLGGFRKAHQVEDMEIALRMQRNNYKIAHAMDAIVYTDGCKTLKELFLQRLRWKRGFILNMIDYKDLLNLKKHGNLAFSFINNIFGIFLSIALLFFVIWNFGKMIYTQIHQFILFPPHLSQFKLPHFDWLMFNFSPIFILGVVSLMIYITYLVLTNKLTKDSQMRYMDAIMFVVIYPILSGAWWISTIWSTIKGKEILWK
jgi:cellulose synthase/poly-beta-1,6-N-acetylglucosamine synthase-like glycosyltransferase